MEKWIAQNHIWGEKLGPNQENGNTCQHLFSWNQNGYEPGIAVYLPFPPSLNGEDLCQSSYSCPPTFRQVWEATRILVHRSSGQEER